MNTNMIERLQAELHALKIELKNKAGCRACVYYHPCPCEHEYEEEPGERSGCIKTWTFGACNVLRNTPCNGCRDGMNRRHFAWREPTENELNSIVRTELKEVNAEVMTFGDHAILEFENKANGDETRVILTVDEFKRLHWLMTLHGEMRGWGKK